MRFPAFPSKYRKVLVATGDAGAIGEEERFELQERWGIDAFVHMTRKAKTTSMSSDASVKRRARSAKEVFRWVKRHGDPGDLVWIEGDQWELTYLVDRCRAIGLEPISLIAIPSSTKEQEGEQLEEEGGEETEDSGDETVGRFQTYPALPTVIERRFRTAGPEAKLRRDRRKRWNVIWIILALVCSASIAFALFLQAVRLLWHLLAAGTGFGLLLLPAFLWRPRRDLRYFRQRLLYQLESFGMRMLVSLFLAGLVTLTIILLLPSNQTGDDPGSLSGGLLGLLQQVEWILSIAIQFVTLLFVIDTWWKRSIENLVVLLDVAFVRAETRDASEHLMWFARSARVSDRADIRAAAQQIGSQIALTRNETPRLNFTPSWTIDKSRMQVRSLDARDEVVLVHRAVCRLRAKPIVEESENPKGYEEEKRKLFDHLVSYRFFKLQDFRSSRLDRQFILQRPEETGSVDETINQLSGPEISHVISDWRVETSEIRETEDAIYRKCSELFHGGSISEKDQNKLARWVMESVVVPDREEELKRSDE